MRFRALVAAAFVLTGVSVASAETPTDRAESAADAASITSRKLRHLWDQLRSSKKSAQAACVEDKVARSMSIATRIEKRRLELKESADDKARAVSLQAIDALDAQRLDLEEEANVCVHGKTLTFPASGTRVTTTVPSSLPKVSLSPSERELMMLAPGAPILGK